MHPNIKWWLFSWYSWQVNCTENHFLILTAQQISNNDNNTLYFGQHGLLTALGPGFWPSRIIVSPRFAWADNDSVGPKTSPLGCQQTMLPSNGVLLLYCYLVIILIFFFVFGILPLLLFFFSPNPLCFLSFLSFLSTSFCRAWNDNSL